MKAAVAKTTHTDINITIRGTVYVITQTERGQMKLEIHHPNKKKGGEVRERYLSIRNVKEVYDILYTLLWRGVTPDTLEKMIVEMSYIRSNPEPARFIEGDVSIEFAYTVIEPGDGKCAHGRAHKYSVYPMRGCYASGYNNETTSASSREVNLHDVPAIYLILSTSDNLPERAIIP